MKLYLNIICILIYLGILAVDIYFWNMENLLLFTKIGWTFSLLLVFFAINICQIAMNKTLKK